MSSISSSALMLIFGQLDMFHSLLQSLAVAVSKHLGHLFPAAVCYIPVCCGDIAQWINQR